MVRCDCCKEYFARERTSKNKLCWECYNYIKQIFDDFDKIIIDDLYPKGEHQVDIQYCDLIELYEKLKSKYGVKNEKKKE